MTMPDDDKGFVNYNSSRPSALGSASNRRSELWWIPWQPETLDRFTSQGGFVMQGRSEGIVANLFTLQGDSINVEYATGTLTGSSLVYHDDQMDQSFANEELTVEDTQLGQLVTVTLRQIPDLETVTFTLVLPSITLTEHNAPPIDIEVPGITTTHSTTIAGPEAGQQTFYSVVTLVGTAEAAVF
jgi:hypothetical protein